MRRLNPNGLLMAGAVLAATATHGEVIHEERSLYQDIMVEKVDDFVCLRFRRGRPAFFQSCRNEKHPERIVLPYTRMMMGALLFTEDINKVLIVGLGGATLPKVLMEVLPTTSIDVVEIDPAIVNVARNYFDFRPTPNVRVFEQDARVFIRRARLEDRRYDLIMLDAFDAEYIPEHLMTVEFFDDVSNILTEGSGVVAANIWGRPAVRDHEYETFSQAFGAFINFELQGTSNKIIFATAGDFPDDEQLKEAGLHWHSELDSYGIRISAYPRHFDRNVQWDRSVKPFTDQYRPLNLIR